MSRKRDIIKDKIMSGIVSIMTILIGTLPGLGIIPIIFDSIHHHNLKEFHRQYHNITILTEYKRYCRTNYETGYLPGMLIGAGIPVFSAVVPYLGFVVAVIIFIPSTYAAYRRMYVFVFTEKLVLMQDYFGLFPPKQYRPCELKYSRNYTQNSKLYFIEFYFDDECVARPHREFCTNSKKVNDYIRKNFQRYIRPKKKKS